MSLEDDYGMIDGIINNGPKEDKASEKGGKASIMDRLKSAKTAQQTDKPCLLYTSRDFIHQKLKPFVENELGCKFTVLRSDKTYDDRCV